MSSDEPIGIVGVGDRLRTEIQSGDFDRFVIFTYGITPGYLEWFDQSDLVAICGPNETVEAVRTTPETPLVSTFNRETHAKMYLLYNDTRMVAYVGSFNFTRTGLYESVEWGARYEGTLVGMPPDPEALLNGETDPEISQSPIIEQLLTIVGASMDASDTDRADSWVANTELGEGVVHTLRSNTLQTALSDTLRDATPPIEITYFSPFVTYDGVREFASYLPPDIDESEVDFTVYTKRLGRIGDTEDLLSPELIERLDDRFRSFRLRARASGDQGNELPDGREIRGGMAHFKTILLGDQCGADAQPLGVLLTSANLSNRAWDRRSTGFEIGVAITESQRAEQLYHFFADELSQCYVDPSKRALSSVGTSTPTRSWGTDEWLDERLRNRLAIESDAVEIAWDDSLPALTELEARVFHRDLDTGVRTEHRASFTPMADGYRAAVPSVTAEANQIIDFVRVIARSRHSPPERIYSTREVRELRADLGIEDDPEILPEEWHEFEELIWNGSIRKTVSEAAFSDIGTIQSVRLRSSHEEPHPYHVTYEPDSQPHINSLIQETTLTTRDVQPLGTVVSLTVETNPDVSLDVEDLLFYTGGRNRVEALGFSRDGDSVTYYFSPAALGDTLTISVQGLLSRYLQDAGTDLSLDGIDLDHVVDPAEVITMEAWQAAPSNPDPVLSKPQTQLPEQFRSEDSTEPTTLDISEEMAVEIAPPEALRSEVSLDALSVWWRPSGAFQSGQIQPVTEPIPPQKPRTRVRYRGLLELTESEPELNLWLPGGNYLVQEQPFVETVTVSLAAIPEQQNLTTARRESLLGWLMIRQEDMLDLRASDVAHYIDVSLYVDGKRVPNRGFPTTSSGGLICIPVLYEHIGTTQELTLRLSISGGPAKTNHYSEAARSFSLSVADERGETIAVHVGEQTRQITNSATGDKPSLEPVADVIQRGEFEEQTLSHRSGEIFRVESYSPLRIIPEEMALFQFTDR